VRTRTGDLAGSTINRQIHTMGKTDNFNAFFSILHG